MLDIRVIDETHFAKCTDVIGEISRRVAPAKRAIREMSFNGRRRLLEIDFASLQDRNKNIVPQRSVIEERRTIARGARELINRAAWSNDASFRRDLSQPRG